VIWRRIAWLLSLGLLLFTGVVGIYNGITEWSGAHTLLQKSVIGGVFLYGVFGLATIYGLLRSRRRSVWSAIIWGVFVAYVPGAAVIGFGGAQAYWSSAIAASVASALIAAAVVWAVRDTLLFRASQRRKSEI
jgi:hypothetical protein